MTVLLLFATILAVETHADDVRRVDLGDTFYLLYEPVVSANDQPLPLIFIFHGTRTRADDIMRFWRSLTYDRPCTLVAPQSSSTGWNVDDLPRIAKILAHVRRTVGYDAKRVLLAGHSAGGAIALHLFYHEGFPATSIAVTACYVPPTVTARALRARNDVPLFYAVGQHDGNRQSMRDGLVLLQTSGVPVTIHSPNIGHVLDKTTTQAALAWFESQSIQKIDNPDKRSHRTPVDKEPS